jgi:hypothetical protein
MRPQELVQFRGVLFGDEASRQGTPDRPDGIIDMTASIVIESAPIEPRATDLHGPRFNAGTALAGIADTSALEAALIRCVF